MHDNLFIHASLALIAAVLPITATQAGRSNRGVESVHQPVVQRSDFVMDVSGNGLDRAEADRVGQWFDAIELSYGDRISIDRRVGPASSNPDITAIVARYGLFVSEGAPATQGAIEPGKVRIVVSRSTASVPGCPDYSRWSQPNYTAATSTNFGCATNSTLAAMVANPEDLIHGQVARGTNSEAATRAIRVWRDAGPTSKNGLKVESTKGDK